MKTNSIQKTVILLLLAFTTFFAEGQTTISGKVVSARGEPLPGVNIFIENTYDGASSDENGEFRFTTTESGDQILIASFIGYKTWKRNVSIGGNPEIIIELAESVNALDAVTITAGNFAAADESRASVMEPLDIYTTASANGDVMAAMRTMPGTQAAADDGRLLVRGGDAYETRTYIDGLLAAKPYYSKTPDVATRGRFAPSLFNGVVFNSGGYSAEYGQALSSVLILNSNDLAQEDVSGLSIMTIGGEVSHTERWKNSSLMLSGGYTNLSGYNKVFNSYIDWQKPVESVNGAAVFRAKTSSSGMLKGYVTADYGNMGYLVPEGPNRLMEISNSGTTAYSNFFYRDCFSEKSCYRAGISSTIQHNKLGLGDRLIDTREQNVEGRFAVVHDAADGVKITWGGNETFNSYRQAYSNDEGEFPLDFTDYLTGMFVESEIRFSKNFGIRPGVRAEYSSAIQQWNFAPRFATGLKTGEEAQLSAAWGMYHQTPQDDYLKLDTGIDFEKAYHYILSYQFGDVSSRLFRAEAYYKTYHDLITFQRGEFGLPLNIGNNGDGYAAGIDIFWRDRKSIKGFDYWITYSCIDTKRKYQDYPERATPYFISDHNFSVVGKYWVSKINTQVGFSYAAAGGRPYNDATASDFMDKKTKGYSDLSLNFSHIFYLGDQYSVLYFSINNVLGNDNVLGYRPSGFADAAGNYSLVPVKRDLKRMVFMGLFLNF